MKRKKRLKVKCKNLVRKDKTSIMNVRKRIKTFEDALFCLDENDELKLLYHHIVKDNISNRQEIIAYVKLCIIIKALNEGWRPTFIWSEFYYYPWIHVYSKEDYKVVCEAYGPRAPKGQLIEKSDKVFTCEGSDSNSSSWVANMPWRVALKSRELAVYCGQQFLDLWVTYLFS